MFLFYAPLTIGLVLLFLFFRRLPLSPVTFLLLSGLTIVLYRLTTLIMLIFFQNNSGWQGIVNDSWNHYQLGFVLLLLSLIAQFIPAKTRLLLSAIASGMIIDEVTDLGKLFFPHLFPPHFRDSLGDFLLICLAYSIFVLIFWRLLPRLSGQFR